MSRLDDQDLDFGHVLESFERESEVHQGTPRPRGKLIRQEPEADAAKPRAYQKPTEEEDFASALAAFDAEQGSAKERTPQVGQAVEGTLLSLDLESALVDFGSKAEGVVATDELVDEDGILLFKVGDTTRFEIAGREPGGTYRLRRAGSGSGQHPLEVGQVVQGVVTAINKGGAEVQVGSKARCFCPFSQLADRRVEDAEQFVGRRLRFEVTKVERTSAVLSRRALLEKEKQERADRLREQLHVGAVVSGRVTAIEDYGVFVDLGGLEGLVHVSELAFERLAHPSERVEMGQELDVQITRLERRSDGRDRISLSRKALDRDPWIDAHQEFQEGVTREGEVQRLESFG
ncbi:MAG: S1 RNA-binding domain-containing protein, partial [Acidobacteriota bacterium]